MPSLLSAEQDTGAQPYRAKGTFTIDTKLVSSAPADGVGRYGFDKQIHGDLEGTSKGEMLTAGDLKQGMAGYVAMEVVTGTLNGKKGTFVFQHTATMDKTGQKMSIVITPGSGTGELKGIAGTFEIKIVNGDHSYTFDYTL